MPLRSETHLTVHVYELVHIQHDMRATKVKMKFCQFDHLDMTLHRGCPRVCHAWRARVHVISSAPDARCIGWRIRCDVCLINVVRTVLSGLMGSRVTLQY